MAKKAKDERDLFDGPVIVRNVHETRRVWPDITTADGHTLELSPGEEALVLTDPGDIAYLTIRAHTKSDDKSDAKPTGGN